MAKQARFPIGLTFSYKRGKAPAVEYRIVDILTTRNNAGEVVRLEYDTVHLFCGQEVHETMVDTTIARSLAPDVFALYNKPDDGAEYVPVRLTPADFKGANSGPSHLMTALKKAMDGNK